MDERRVRGLFKLKPECHDEGELWGQPLTGGPHRKQLIHLPSPRYFRNIVRHDLSLWGVMAVDCRKSGFLWSRFRSLADSSFVRVLSQGSRRGPSAGAVDRVWSSLIDT
jgi:hypothetical protein